MNGWETMVYMDCDAVVGRNNFDFERLSNT